MAITSANQLELLQTAEAVAREKMIDPDLVIEAMEDSLARAAKSRYGAEMDIRVVIDRKTGNATFTRVRTVVPEEELENYQAQFTADQAKPYFETQKDAGNFWTRDGQRLDDFAGGPQPGGHGLGVGVHVEAAAVGERGAVGGQHRLQVEP